AAGTDEGLGVAVGSGGSVYVTGDFAGTVDFNPVGVTPGDTLTSAGAGDAFVLQLDASGNFVRVGRLGGTRADTRLGVAVDGPGNAALPASFTGATSGLAVLTADTDSGPGFTDAFVLKLTPSGTGFTTGSGGWAESFGAEGDDAGRAVTFDTSGKVLVAG